MKRFLPVLALLSTFYFLFSASVRGQTPYSQALSDYQFTAGKYNQAYQDFVLARNRYLKSETLANRETAYEATKTMLIWRSRVLETYFAAQETRASEVGAASLGVDLPFTSQQKELAEKTTLEELLAFSDQIQKDYLTNWQKLAYRHLSQILIQKEKNKTRAAETLLGETEALVARIGKEEKDVAILDTWLTQIKAEIANARAAQDKATAALSNFDSQRSPKEVFTQIKNNLGKSTGANQQILSFLAEVVGTIKNE